MLQQGYAFGYLMATVFARAFVNTVGHGWRPLFWFGAGPPVLIIIFRLCLPRQMRISSASASAKKNPTPLRCSSKKAK
jgi:MFS family permease